MGQKQCEKCGEMVGEAKAFCPACGHAFVEEETRKEASAYERMDNTVQFGQTMYDMMLSDMGLNISKPAEQPAKRIEVLSPAAAPPPAATAPAAKPAEKAEQNAKKPGNTKWFIIGGVVLLVVFFVVAAGAAAAYIYWTKFR